MSVRILFPYKIMLGSKSPRRSFLLKESGFDYEIKVLEVDESFPEDLAKNEVAEFIANKKAAAYERILPDDMLGLVADTVVVLEGEILEKPANKEEAVKMLRQLSGKKHTVFTGVCLFDKNHKRSFTGRSEVYFMDLRPNEIDYYIEHYKPYDKAGAYGVQEWLGYTKIEKIDGSYSNIMGLPMELVYKHLFEFIKH